MNTILFITFTVLILLMICSIVVTINENFKHPSVIEITTGDCYYYIGKCTLYKSHYNILRSTKDAGYILVCNKDLNNKFKYDKKGKRKTDAGIYSSTKH